MIAITSSTFEVFPDSFFLSHIKIKELSIRFKLTKPRAFIPNWVSDLVV